MLIDGDSTTSSFAISNVESDISLHAETNKIEKQGGQYSQQFKGNKFELTRQKLIAKACSIFCCANCCRNNCYRWIGKNDFGKACGRKGHISIFCFQKKVEVSALSAINNATTKMPTQ